PPPSARRCQIHHRPHVYLRPLLYPSISHCDSISPVRGFKPFLPHLFFRLKLHAPIGEIAVPPAGQLPHHPSVSKEPAADFPCVKLFSEVVPPLCARIGISGSINRRTPGVHLKHQDIS